MNPLTSRGFGLLVSLATALALVAGFAPAARADTPPNPLVIADIFGNINPSQKLVTGIRFELHQDDGSSMEGITVHLSAFSCGNFLGQRDLTMQAGISGYTGAEFSPDGQPTLSENVVNRKVGKSIEYQIDIVHPGYDAYHLTGSWSDYGTVDGKPLSSYRPTCEQINGGGTGGTPTCVVKAPATKIGKARIGRTLKVRPPSTNGQCGRVSYTWKVAGKTVKNGKTLSIGRGMRGKGVTVKVNLSKGPDRVLRFGRVK